MSRAGLRLFETIPGLSPLTMGSPWVLTCLSFLHGQILSACYSHCRWCLLFPEVSRAVWVRVLEEIKKGKRKTSQRRSRQPMIGYSNNHLKVWAWPCFDLFSCFIFFFTFCIPFILITVSPDFSFYFCICHKIKQIIPVFGNDLD